MSNSRQLVPTGLLPSSWPSLRLAELPEPILSSPSFSGCLCKSTLYPGLQTMAAGPQALPLPLRPRGPGGIKEAPPESASHPGPTADPRGDRVEDAGLELGLKSGIRATHILIGAFLPSLWAWSLSDGLSQTSSCYISCNTAWNCYLDIIKKSLYF